MMCDLFILVEIIGVFICCEIFGFVMSFCNGYLFDE